MKRGHHARFPEVASPPPAGATVLDPRRFAVHCDDGSQVLVDLRDWKRPKLAAEMAVFLEEYIRRMGPSPIARSVRRKVKQLGLFWTFLDRDHLSVSRLGDIDTKLINDYELWLERNGGGRFHQRHLLATLIGLLRLAPEMRGGTLSQETVARLTFIGHGEGGVSQPRDAYSSGIASRLRDAARVQIEDARRRIALGDARPALPERMEIGSRVHEHYTAVIEAIVRLGQVGTRRRDVGRFVQLARYRGIDNTMEALHAGFYLTRLDLIAFIVLLSLETGMEMECLLRLKADCLRNPTKGYVEIEYYKRRARGSEWKRLRVRDGGSGTPGGLIRLAVALTERARGHLGTDRLWAIWTITGLRLPSDDGPQGVEGFVGHHQLLDDDGAPLHLSLARLRKTNKAEWYRKTGGQLEHFAVGHSIPVAARHYAEIPALRPIHERTIAAAIGDALEMALRPTILLPDVDELRASVQEQRVASTGRRSASSKDLWLARCGSFFKSPFGSAGEACPTPFWGCLECENAVITARKLPTLVAFQSFMLAQRDMLDTEEWASKFGRAWWRVTAQILPAFPSALVEAARIEAEAAGPELLYLPVEARI
ncbi:hypothetical protein GCM10023219_19900 [Stakelama sediminis]|uniref:Core-binding (CB) domain-containing protein n=1 Tax=Stakelama sediminis TaxID=463200 RepID=A0A840Z3C0_9SPHN|nr:hypothetical protein [Stakelama sediminis]